MIECIDHLVITTAQPEACLAFYQACGFRLGDAAGRYELFAGSFKINVHLLGRELLPHAEHIQPGSTDLCFSISGSLEEFRSALESKGLPIELGVVLRTGAKGAMRSIYLRDPDGNLVEFCSYSYND